MVLVVLSGLMILSIGIPGIVLSSQGLGGRLAGALLTGSIVFALFVLWSIRVRVSLDETRKIVVVEIARWPLSAKRSAYPLNEVLDVAVEKNPRSTTCRLAFVLTGGVRAPLTRSYFGSHALHARAADAVRNLLRDVE
jgi:hypothetical protein